LDLKNYGLAISSEKLASTTILVSTSFAWLFMFFEFFTQIFPTFISEEALVYSGYFIFLGLAASSAIVGAVMGEKIERRKFLLAWVILGLVTNILLFFTPSFGATGFLLICAILGVSIGLGFPSCLGYFADCTEIEERARIAGLIILLTLVIVIGSFVLASAIGYGFSLLILLLAIKASSFSTFFLDTCERPKNEVTPSWKKVFMNKDFILYLFPWLMFSFTGSLINPIVSLVVTTVGLALHFIFWAIFGLISGVLADRLGRKQPIIIGLILLGISFAILSITITPLTVLIYNALSGVAWGFLFAVYISVLGDLALSGSKEKFYALGAIMPFILMLGLTALTTMFNVTLSEQILPLLTILLFLSILPVLRAAETLPKKAMHARMLKEHIDKVGKVVKESKKQKRE
jgi:MFS family permease